MKFELTKGEEKAIHELNHAFKILGRRHWFFAVGSGLLVMRNHEKGNRAITNGGSMDQEYAVTSVGVGQDIDGGDF